MTGLGIFIIGSPWIGAKALATASVAVPLAGAVGACALFGVGRRVEGAVLLAVIAAGILWSNGLAYRDVNLAPRAQLAELETIGNQIGGEGPALMTEYNPYGVRHFLRDADPEGSSELRSRQDTLLSGRTLPALAYADTDRFQLATIMQYRTLVLRRSPAQSRPPAPYQLIYRGHYYEAWQRPEGSEGTVLGHLGLGNVVQAGAVPRCPAVMRLAREAGPSGSLAAVPRSRVDVHAVTRMSHPKSWNAGYGQLLVPRGAGTLKTSVDIRRAGSYAFWLGGGVRPQVDLVIDGEVVNSIRAQLEEYGQYALLGDVPLEPGRHSVEIHFHGPDLLPDSGGRADAIGPLAISSQDTADTHLVQVLASQARRLCGMRLDWVEAFGG